MRCDETGEGFLDFQLSFSYPQFHYVKKRVVDSAWSEMDRQDEESNWNKKLMAITHNDFGYHVISLFPPCHVYIITLQNALFLSTPRGYRHTLGVWRNIKQ